MTSIVLRCAIVFALMQVVGAVAAREEPEEAERKEFERLSGGYAVTRFEVDGRAVPAADLKKMKVVRNKDRWTLTRGKEETSFADSIDLAMKPRHIDITVTSAVGKDDTYLGIYETKDDTLRICYAEPDGNRPVAFNAARGTECTLIELRRFRPPTVKVVRVLPEWPVPGGKAKLVVAVTDPEEGACRVEYQIAGTSAPKSIASATAEVEIDVPETGAVAVSVRGFSDRGGRSESVVHMVSGKEPKLTVAPVNVEVVTNSVGMKFVKVPAGEFAMGSATGAKDADKDEYPRHGVRIPAAYLLGQYEVTFGDYKKVMGVQLKLKNFLFANPQANEAWIEATPEAVARLCDTLNNLPAEMAAGRSYRLPTEEEWEYACRAGTATPFSTGKVLRDALFDNGNSGFGRYSSAPVGKFKPNAFGLYDMHGNASELCLARDYWAAPADATALPAAKRVVYSTRGGSATDEPAECRSAVRSVADAKRANSYIGGVRLVCEIGEPRKASTKPLTEALDGWTGATKLWTLTDGTFATGTLPRRADAAMYTRTAAIGDFTASFDLKVTGAALFGLRFRGKVTNPTDHITTGPMFLFAGPDRTEDRNERYSWFTLMGQPRWNWASEPKSAKTIKQLVEPGKFNPVVITAKGGSVTAKLHGEVVWEGDIRDVAAEGVFGLVVVTDNGGSIELKNFKLDTGAKREPKAEPAPAAGPQKMTWEGDGVQGRAKFKVSMDMTRDGDSISGSYTGGNLKLTFTGTVSGKTVRFNAFLGNELWSENTGTIDLAAGTLTLEFTPKSRRAIQTPGTIELKLKP